MSIVGGRKIELLGKVKRLLMKLTFIMKSDGQI